MRRYIISWINFNFRQIGQPGMELAALERRKKSLIHIMEKTMSSHFLVCFDQILVIFAGNDDIHKSLNEFEIWPDPTIDYGVSCP